MKEISSEFVIFLFREKWTWTQSCYGESKLDGMFDLIHCDIWHPYRIASFYRAHYFLIITNDESTTIWLYLMKNKSETSGLLKDFMIWLRTNLERGLKWGLGVIIGLNLHMVLCFNIMWRTVWFTKQGPQNKMVKWNLDINMFQMWLTCYSLKPIYLLNLRVSVSLQLCTL